MVARLVTVTWDSNRNSSVRSDGKVPMHYQCSIAVKKLMHA